MSTTVPVILPSWLKSKRQYLRTVIVTADIHQGLYHSPNNIATTQRRYLTFWHWSGVTPYTSSYEFAGSCVFGKQLAGILSLRPPLFWTLTFALTNNEKNYFLSLVNFLQYLEISKIVEGSLIPKLRLLFCRVPWGPLTRSSWSNRPDHLCRFAVRILYR